MKRIKKMLSIMLAMVMTLAMCSSVFATNNGPTDATKDNYTITLNGKTSGHTYTAYQVFKGELASKDSKLVLSNIKWGDGVKDTANLVKELAKIAGSDITEGMTAAQVAEKLQEQADNSDVIKAVTDVIGKAAYLGTPAGTSTEKENTNNVYTISVKKAGYYFIKDTGVISSNGTATDYILEVVGDATVNTKDDVVDLDKEIVSGNDQGVSSNKASIGDDVTYRLKSKVPDHAAYKKYYFIMNDTLSAGLTFNNDVVVKIGDKELVRDTDYYIYEGTNDTSLSANATATAQSFKIAFANIKEYEVGANIVVTYSAKLNENAVIGENGNTNAANLTYSNNPNDSGSGDPDTPDEKPGIPDNDKNVPLGNTPDKVVVTFTTQVAIFKTQNGNTTPLEGAEFTLTGISKQTALATEDVYTSAEDGTWYSLTDGSYTETAPQTVATMEEAGEGATAGYVVAEDDYTGDDIEVVGDVRYRPYREGDTGTIYKKIEPNADKYASTTIKYKHETATTTTVTERAIKMVGTSDEKGQIIFKGLGEGEYLITETKTPAGFNTAAPIKVVIKGEVSGTAYQATCKWIHTLFSDGVVVRPLKDDTHEDGIEDEYYVNIVNNSGSTLPSTGGIGTTIFYIIGGILVVGAAILLVTKKRMSKEA